ncbi:MAG: sensor histidine kinase [Cellvibrionaceae bacterium]|nr:sensor histidine kinase [Cellvibrionaceae bacterium]
MSILNNTLDKNPIYLFRQLLILRTAVLLCIIGVCLVARSYLAVEIAIAKICTVLALSLGFSALFAFYHHKRGAVSALALYLQLVFDALLLATVVYFTGGSANPFIYYWLVLIAICAAIFNRRSTVIFTSITIALYSGMLYIDMGHHLQHTSSDFGLHLIGMWINFVGSALLITFFIGYLAAALRARQEMLAKVREDTLKNEQLVGIGTLAASTLHSLGTPLSSLNLLAEELGDLARDRDQALRAQMMQEQVARCKETLSRLSRLTDNEHFAEAPKSAAQIIAEIAEHYKVTAAAPMPVFSMAAHCDSVFIQHNLLLTHALINLIDNAIRAAKTKVQATVGYDEDFVKLQIVDDGDGVPEEISNYWGQSAVPSANQGMGIGVFLANSTIEKLGGSINLQRLDTKRATSLTEVSVKLPRCEALALQVEDADRHL